MSAFAYIFIAISASLVLSSEAQRNEVFLGSRGQSISAAGLNSGGDLLHELEKVAGRDHRVATEARVVRLENALRPMFAAMPKDHAGLVDSVGTRYMLHRLFVQRHGWFVIGLDNAGDAWNSSSPADVFKEHAGDHQDLFQGKLTTHGFSLHQVAVFGATLETLVHGESLERLQAAYRVLGLSKSESLSAQEGREVIQAYMLMYVQQIESATLTPGLFRIKLRQATDLYPTWPDTLNFAEEIRQRILEDTDVNEQNTWATTLKVVEEIAERYGHYQDQECNVMKSKLVEIERPGSGRVRLSDFYAPALHDHNWMFTESKSYLQQLGALDESNPQQPSVIITNYVNSPVNCVASSKFYSVCCIDKCEDLLGTLENRIAAPDATPARIAELVAALKSDTVQAPRVLSGALLQRLEDIAVHHGGLVPLHGRLFAQWLHHAYPRECPYPHMSGTTKPLTQEDYLARSNDPLEADRDEVQRMVDDSKLSHQSADAEESADVEGLPWSHEEELFINRPNLPDASRSRGSSAGTSVWRRLVVFMVALLSLGAWLILRSPSLAFSPDHKYFV